MTMSRLHAVGTVFTAALWLAGTESALAQSARVFVSAQTGVDGNPCTATLPCRTLAFAMLAVAAGGEVLVLDSGGYGPVTVTKSVSLVSPPGVYAGVTAAPGGVAVNVAVSASDVVVL